MTSIYHIPFEDIKIFLKANNKSFKNNTDAYNITLKLLKNKNIIGHTVKIVEWMIAYNLLINKINIPKYNIYEIDFASKDEINELSNSLNIKENNINTLKYILRCVGKLEERIAFLPEINNVIIEKYQKLFELDILSSNLCDIIKIFKDNRFLRKFIYDNIKYIIDKNKLQKTNRYYIDYQASDFIFELAELKEIFLAKRVFALYRVLPHEGEAILSCSRFYIKDFMKHRI
jgi:hypothetical protein